MYTYEVYSLRKADRKTKSILEWNENKENQTSKRRWKKTPKIEGINLQKTSIGNAITLENTLTKHSSRD